MRNKIDGKWAKISLSKEFGYKFAYLPLNHLIGISESIKIG